MSENASFSGAKPPGMLLKILIDVKNDIIDLIDQILQVIEEEADIEAKIEESEKKLLRHL